MPYMINGHRDYKREYNLYHARKKQKENRAERNKAHHDMEARVGHHIAGDVDHIKPLSKGGSNLPSNWRIRSAHANRSYPRTRSGAIKD